MAVAWPTEPPELNELFRYALFLSADRAASLRTVKEVLQLLATKPESGEADRARRFCFWEIRKRILKTHAHPVGALLTPAESPKGTVLQVLRGFPEPVRSAAALFYLTRLQAKDIGRILDLPEKQLATEMALVRANLPQTSEVSA